MAIEISPEAGAALRAAMKRSMRFLITGAAKAPVHRAYNRVMVEFHLWAAVEQALLAGDQDLAFRLQASFSDAQDRRRAATFDDQVAGLAAEIAAIDAQLSEIDAAKAGLSRRKLVHNASPGQRARVKLRKRGVTQIAV